MSLADIVDAIPDFSTWSHVDKMKLFAWYLHRDKAQDRFGQADIRNCYDELNLDKPANVNPYLDRLVKSRPKQVLRDARGFSLEKRIRDELEAKYGQRPASVQVHRLLADLPSRIPSLVERRFLEEALVCLRHGAPRAAIVMTWNLAFDHLCGYILDKHLAAFNAQWPARFPKAHSKSAIMAVGKRDDFGGLKESDVLDICKSANIISANAYKILREKLDRRNIAAHPNSVVFTTLQAEDFVTDLINNVVSQLL